MAYLSLPAYIQKPRAVWRGFARKLAGIWPKGLYARSLLIVILPMVLLQIVVTYVFMERHWQLVTTRLSAELTEDIAALIDLSKAYPAESDIETLTRIAQDRLKMDVEFLPKGPLPPVLQKPFFSIGPDGALSNEIRKQIGRPFWLDTVGRSNFIEIRVLLDNAILRVVALRSAAYASNSYIFILWMTGTSAVLLIVAIAFLRNQIRPILRLVGAAEAFGKGREVDFRPRGAREVRQAGYAFIEMKRRIERAIEQRTTMLNGVSHDLRTILTRFKLSLALMGGEDSDEMQKDVDEMQRMLEAYLSFARGDAGEPSVKVDMRHFLEDICADAQRHGHDIKMSFTGDPEVAVRADAFKRCLTNLVGNACPSCQDDLDRGHPRRSLPDDSHRRRWSRHSGRPARRCLQALLPSRRSAQSGRRHQ